MQGKPWLLRPHLVIYLDVPVPIVQQRIQQRSLSYEVNSKALTTEYLHALEKHWKNYYLKEIRYVNIFLFKIFTQYYHVL